MSVSYGKTANFVKYERSVLESDPIAYWQLREVAGSTVAVELINGYNGSYINGVTLGVDGPMEKTAYYSNNITKYMQVDDNDDLDLVSVGSVEFWFKPYSGLQIFMPLVTKGYRTGWCICYDNRNDLNTIAWRGTDAGSPNFASQYFSNDQWNHIVVTWNNTSILAYTNGKADGVLTQTPVAATNTPLRLGNDLLLSGYNMQGHLAEISLYNRVLSLDEISNHYNSATS